MEKLINQITEILVLSYYQRDIEPFFGYFHARVKIDVAMIMQAIQEFLDQDDKEAP